MSCSHKDDLLYLIIGNGKAAKHFLNYLGLLNLPYDHWYRKAHSTKDFSKKAKAASHVLCLISDDEIESFLQSKQIELKDKICLHFSGVLHTKYAISVHPLMTFSHNELPNDIYKTIPFIWEKRGYEFKDLLPGIPNPNKAVELKDRAFYHALCVISGNFTNMLWKKFFQEAKDRFQMDEDYIKPYMRAVFQNLQMDPFGSLTGPLARGDQQTISKNLEALKSDPFEGVYRAFVDMYKKGEL